MNFETQAWRSVAGVRCGRSTCERASSIVKHGLRFRASVALGRDR